MSAEHHQVNQDTGAQAAGRALGNNTKSSSPPPKSRQELRTERYLYQSTAREITGVEGKKAGLQYPFEWHRVGKCCHVRYSTDVEIHKSREHGVAHYGGLVRCGSVWACPVCAAAIQETRRQEIAQAIDWAYDNGMKAVMVTLTFPHRSWHKLNDLLEQQADALRRLRSGKVWQRIKGQAGFRGLIRSLELTRGDNGWHPHTHELWFVDADCDADWLKGQILDRWEKCCIRAGLLDPDNRASWWAFRIRSVDLHDNASSSEYLAKQDDSRHWGADREVASATSKAGKASGIHPFGLLRRYEDATEKADKAEAARLFVEYMTGMKGRRQVFWSHGLKAQVGVDDRDDQAIVEEQDDAADLLGLLNRDEWGVVIAARAKGKVLDLAETGGIAAVRTWISEQQTRLAGGPKNLAAATASADPGSVEAARCRALDGPSAPLRPDPLALVSDWRQSVAVRRDPLAPEPDLDSRPIGGSGPAPG